MVFEERCFCNDSAWLFDVPSIGLFYLSWLRDDTRRVVRHRVDSNLREKHTSLYGGYVTILMRGFVISGAMMTILFFGVVIVCIVIFKSVSHR